MAVSRKLIVVVLGLLLVVCFGGCSEEETEGIMIRTSGMLTPRHFDEIPNAPTWLACDPCPDTTDQKKAQFPNGTILYYCFNRASSFKEGAECSVTNSEVTQVNWEFGKWTHNQKTIAVRNSEGKWEKPEIKTENIVIPPIPAVELPKKSTSTEANKSTCSEGLAECILKMLDALSHVEGLTQVDARDMTMRYCVRMCANNNTR